MQSGVPTAAFFSCFALGLATQLLVLVVLDPLQQFVPLAVLQVQSVRLLNESLLHDVVFDVQQPQLFFLVGV